MAKEKLKSVGKVVHFFGNIGVGVIKFSSAVKKGDTILIEGGGKSFSQKITSLEYDHKKVMAAKKGQELGIKLRDKVREGYRVFKK